MFSMVVQMEVRPGCREEFLAGMKVNAQSSVRDEPGCLRFDVNQSVSDPHRFVFYELYADEAALDAHRQAPHFGAWRTAADMHVVPGSQVNTVSELHLSHSD